MSARALRRASPPPNRRWYEDEFDAPRDHEPAVHCRAVDPFWTYCAARSPHGWLLEGTSLNQDASLPEQISWAQFLIITQNFLLRFGSSDEVLFEMTRGHAALPSYAVGKAFAGLLASPRTLYHAAARWFSPKTFGPIPPNVLRELEFGRFELEIELKPGYTACEHFFLLNRAMITTATSNIGLPDAIVTMKSEGDRATYFITPPTSRTLLERGRRFKDVWLHGGRSVAAHLEGQFEELQRTNAELQAKVTELEQIRDKLEHTRAQHLRAINGTREGIWELNSSSGLLDVSPRWAEIMTGVSYRAPMLTLDDWRAMICIEDIDHFDASLEAHLCGEKSGWSCTFRVRRGGEGEAHKWVRARGRASREVGAQGVSVYLSGSIVDITLAERARQDMPLLFKEVPSPLCVASHHEGQIVFVNDAFIELLAVEGEPCWVRCGDDVTRFMSQEQWLQLRDDVRASAVEREQLWRLPQASAAAHASEQLKEVGVRAQPITLLNGPCVLIHAEDLAERRDEQARHMHMDRILAMGTMAASIGHEINNPMAFLQSNLEFALSLLPRAMRSSEEEPRRQEIHEDLQSSLSEAFEGAQRVVRIVRNLRSFSQHSRVEHDGELQRVTLESLIAPAMSMVRAELAQVARLRVETSLDLERTGARVEPARVVQVLTNLLINAAHAIEAARSAEPRLSATPHHDHQVTLRVEPQGRGVRFEVHDTGVGIDPSDLERIFQPFFTRKRLGQGTGLGLYICRIITEELKGELEVKSDLGEGSVFTFVLPDGLEIKPPASSTGEADEAMRRRFDLMSTSQSKPSLLIIDDERPLLTSFERKLAEHFEVHLCEHGDAALSEISQGYTPHLILCDVLMPTMNGVELFDALKREHPELCERIVFMSGGSSGEMQREIESRGVDLIAKPLEQLPLLRLLDAMLRRHGAQIGSRD